MEERWAKQKRPGLFHFKPKRMTQDRKAKGQRSGASIPNHGISSSNAWAYCISSPNAWARGISSQNAHGQRGEALGIFTRIAHLPCVLVRISISKQNAPINEVPPVSRTPLSGTKCKFWSEMRVFACFLPCWPEGGPRKGGRGEGKPSPREVLDRSTPKGVSGFE